MPPRWVIAANVAAFVAGLVTYEFVALAASMMALGIASYALYRVDRAEKSQAKREEGLEARASALGQALRDDLSGG